MIVTGEHPHLEITGATRAALGRSRGEQLRGTLREAYRWYASLFRNGGITLEQERAGAQLCLDAVRTWRPEIAEEFAGIAEASGLDVLEVVALNARTEILALGAMPAKECSTVAAEVDGRQLGVQTWDWHVELDPFWHTHEVDGPGHRFVGVTEQGIIGKIGVNEAGLAVHFNILGHEQDGPGGIPMHVLANTVLTECSSVAEAIALVRTARIGSSSSITVLDTDLAVSIEITPVGIFEIPRRDGYVIRTNHFQHPEPRATQKAGFEPDSSARFALVRSRLAGGLPKDADALVDLLLSTPDEAPLSCVADPAKPFGERWQTLCTCITDPEARTIRVLDGMPTQRAGKTWRVLRA